MNDQELDKLFAAARGAPPATARVEYGFETRLLARLRAERAAAVPWSAWAWRLAPWLAIVVVAAGVWTYSAWRRPVDLETAMLGHDETAALATVLLGD